MSRIRTIKPELFKHEELFETERKTGLPLRLAFIGLLTCCDREGRFRWKPRQLKLDVLPYDEEINFEEILNALVTYGFILKYEINGQYYGCFPSWHKHQRINNKESDSEIPSHENGNIISVNHGSFTREPREAHACVTENQDGNSCLNLTQGEGERKGRERNKEVEEEKEREEEGNGVSASCRVDDVTTTPSAIVISIPINSGSEYPITKKHIEQWESLYPGIDVMQELRNIVGWNLANPIRRKTKSGILKHINRWLSKAQNESSAIKTSRSPPGLYEYNKSVAESWVNKTSKENVYEH